MRQVDERVFRGSDLIDCCQFSELARKGVKTVCSLQSGLSDSLNRAGAAFEAHECQRLGLEFLWVKMSFFLPPTEDQVLDALVVLQTSEAPFYVHCFSGVDRTGVVIAAYRVSECGWTWQRAYDEMLASGFHSWRFFWWKPFIKRILKNVNRF